MLPREHCLLTAHHFVAASKSLHARTLKMDVFRYDAGFNLIIRIHNVVLIYIWQINILLFTQNLNQVTSILLLQH